MGSPQVTQGWTPLNDLVGRGFRFLLNVLPFLEGEMPESQSVWTMIVTALGVGLVAVITLFFNELKVVVADWFAALRKRLKRESYAARITAIAKFMTAIEALREVPQVDRVIVYRGHNCGGMPTPGKPFFVRAFYGWSKDKNKDPMDRYDFEISVDLHYMKVLEEVLITDKGGLSKQKVSEMPEGSRLRMFYENEGVVESRLYFLAVVEEELLYCSVASYKEPFSAGCANEIDLRIEQLRSALDDRINKY